MNAYRLAIALIVGVVFAAQRPIKVFLEGTPCVVAGYAASLGFLLAIAEFATLAIGRRVARLRAASDHERGPVTTGVFISLVSLLLLLDLCSKALSPYLALQRRRPATVPLVIVVAFWVIAIALACRAHAPRRFVLGGVVGVIVGTHLLVLWASPFANLSGDMLLVINPSLTELLAGRFPYVDFPPAMPYLPLLFLSYLPPRLVGLDLRYTNLAFEAAAALVVVLAAPSTLGRGRANAAAIPERGFVSVDQVVVPLFMLHPVWIQYSVNTHFAPCVFTAALLGRALTSATPRVQAAALGLALGSSQMLFAVGPVVFAY